MVAIPYTYVLLYMSEPAPTGEVPLRRRLHDGPDKSIFLLGRSPLNLRKRWYMPPSLRYNGRQRANLSYSVFDLNLTDQSRIQAKYEAFMSQRKETHKITV